MTLTLNHERLYAFYLFGITYDKSCMHRYQHLWVKYLAYLLNLLLVLFTKLGRTPEARYENTTVVLLSKAEASMICPWMGDCNTSSNIYIYRVMLSWSNPTGKRDTCVMCGISFCFPIKVINLYHLLHKDLLSLKQFINNIWKSKSVCKSKLNAKNNYFFKLYSFYTALGKPPSDFSSET